MSAYTTSLQHILAELERLDLLIRIQVWRARQQHGDQEAGLPAFYISEAEIDTLLERTIGAPSWAAIPLPPALLEPVQARLDELAAVIVQRTAESLRQGMYLRLVALAQLFDLAAFDVDIILICLAPELDWR